jgi:hypothetical protein
MEPPTLSIEKRDQSGSGRWKVFQQVRVALPQRIVNSDLSAAMKTEMKTVDRGDHVSYLRQTSHNCEAANDRRARLSRQ